MVSPVGGWMTCRIIVSAPVPFPFLWTLDFEFGTWIWDLYFGHGFGTGLGLDNNFIVYTLVASHLPTARVDMWTFFIGQHHMPNI